MSLKYLTLTMAAVSAFDTISVTENGQQKTMYVVGPNWYPGTEGGKVKINHGGRSYLATQNQEGPMDYYAPNLRGGVLEFTVDLSQAKCGCNHALYLVRMPGKNQDGTVRPSEGNDYYCDANRVGGDYCPEFDVMEANTYAWQSTPHKCNAPSGKGWYDWCDGSGKCWQKAHDQGTYGPGKQLDTTKPFTSKTTFDASNYFTTELSQNGFKITMNSECGDYYPGIAGDLEAGMTIAISNWGGQGIDMSWLDGSTGCQEQCDNNGNLFISDIKITTGGSGPHPPPTPGHYDFGDKCDHPNDGKCGNNCSADNCRWSWPSNDPAKWASKDADCRCKGQVMESSSVSEIESETFFLQ